jgi:hypothetical protein
MKPSREDILKSIEFELIQGAISRDDLGSSIQVVRQHQNRLRGELLDGARPPGSVRDVLPELFQINEMLITISQEMNAAVQSLRMELRRIARMSQMPSSLAGSTAESLRKGDVDAQMTKETSALVESTHDMDQEPPPDVGSAMHPKALQVDLDIRPTTIPVVGGFVRRLRLALHDLVLFYLRQLAQKQVVVNQTYGEWVLHLIEMSEHQQDHIDLLNARVAALEARLAEGENE